jgi:hypothetical protein
MSDTAEQQAREILDRLSIDDALSMTAGDVVEIANLIRDRDRLARDVLVLTNALDSILSAALCYRLEKSDSMVEDARAVIAKATGASHE